MRILVIGYGSIGKRHLKNISSLGYNDVAVVSRKGEINNPGLNVYISIDEALKKEKFDAAFICTPTSCHIKDLLSLLEKNVELIYVEKPLSDSQRDLERILQLPNLTSANVVVGYDLHFDPGFEKVKELLAENVIGKIVSANAFVGQHLSQWRPYEDHRSGMSAKKETGGGVMLDLIHEIDYLYHFFGNVKFVASTYANSGVLEIETEEAAEMLLKFSNGVMSTVHLDYLQSKVRRFCIFTGTHGTIHWDLVEQKITVTSHNKQEEFSYAAFQRDDRFTAIVKAFLQSPEDERLTHLPDAIKSLQIVLAAKHAAEHDCVVDMSEWSMVN